MKYVFAFLVCFFISSGALFLVLKSDKYDFIAESANGEVSLKSFNGKYKILYFGYLFCPDVCPSTLAFIGDVLNEIKRDDFELVFITLDPERDTPENLTLMVQNFYKNAIGLRLKNLDKVAKNYGVKYQKINLKNSAMLYSIAHSSSIYLFDKDSKFFTEVSNLTPQNIRENIKNLINNRP
ncbi:SCO family protein [Campylobacter sp. faydin G-24]|uniref:SCO family protein n=1 Tax=Campylobacter anatolicus TaxID=2829105 RepID=A0ABS5HK13_9BACT|nr:SCO family protein [Campylobacter anatolicus]MBR8464598.1 SCO family protein [Campylobacter anatolicus]